ncbi:MAG: phosphatase PAP2 family protein [Acidobacteriota bacterium]
MRDRARSLARGRLEAIDAVLSREIVALVRRPATLAALRTATRLGDWSLSFGTAILLLGTAGGIAAGRFAVASAVGLIVQLSLKAAVARIRPCMVEGGPEPRVDFPDAGSFPSGHTLHAALAATSVSVAVPPLGVAFVPLAAVIAFSRVALGVHYPSDVVAGGSMGVILGLAAALI